RQRRLPTGLVKAGSRRAAARGLRLHDNTNDTLQGDIYMKKYASALAVAAMLAAPAIASAQAQGPTVYGRVHMSLDYQDNDVDSGLNLSSNATRFGIKGAEALGDTGLTAVYQLETEIGIDDAANTGIASMR